MKRPAFVIVACAALSAMGGARVACALKEVPLAGQVAAQQQALAKLNAEIAELRRQLHIGGAKAAVAGGVQMGITYPGAEAPSVVGAGVTAAAAKPTKTPLIIVAPKSMMNFNNLYDKMVLESATMGSEANQLMKTQDESLSDPTERLKMLRREEEEAAKMEAFYKADEAETKYATKEYSRGLMGRAKSFFHDLRH